MCVYRWIDAQRMQFTEIIESAAAIDPNDAAVEAVRISIAVQLLTTEIELCQGMRNSNRQNGTAQPYKNEKEEKGWTLWWKMIQISIIDCSGAAFFPVCYFGQTFIDVLSITVNLHQPCTIWSSAQASRIMILIPVLIQRSMHGIILILTQIVLHIILTDSPRWDMRESDHYIIFLASHCFPRKYLGEISKTNIEGFIIILRNTLRFSIVKKEGWLIAKIKSAWHTWHSWIWFLVFSN